MATWKRSNGNPISTEKYARVYSDDGREGHIAVRWENQHADLFGPVVQIKQLRDDGGAVIEEKIEVLDHFPKLA